MEASRVQRVSRALYRDPANPKNVQSRVCKKDMVARVKTTVSCENVDLKSSLADNKVTKKDGNWRYPGGKIQRGEHLSGLKNANGQPYIDDRNKDDNLARRKIESNFFITLNTNRSLKESLGVSGACADVGREAARQTLDYLAKDSSICRFMKFGPVSKHYQYDKYNDVVKSVEWTSSVETGENYERLHVHIWLTVHHYSQVQINRPVISAMFKEYYNGLLNKHIAFKPQLQCKGRPYCNVKLLPTSDWAMVLRQYIHKAMAPGQNAADFLGTVTKVSESPAPGGETMLMK